ncbi:MAG TPA: hypothetical protein VEA38_05210 [Terriglobales bacterium]|nr:hypothetical protein [Terriglobales bacterium]
MTAADVVADGVRRAGTARVFAAAGADPTLIAALARAGVPLVTVPRASSACAMAAVTAGLTDAPGVVVLAADDDEARPALSAALRARAGVVVLAPVAPAEPAPVKTTVLAGADSAAHWIAHAAQAAMAPPSGVVWLVVTADVASRASLPVATAPRAGALPIDPAAVDAVAARLAAGLRPLIVAGRECRAPAAAPWLRALAESLPAPVVVTPAARGALPDPHPLSFGVLRAGAPIIGRADVVLALGVHDDELAAGVVAAPVLRLGRAPGIAAAADATGDVAALVEELAPRLRERARADWDVAELDRLRRARPMPVVDPALATLVTRVREATPAGTAAVFAPALASASELWQAVTAGDVLIDARPMAAAAAVALERPEYAVLVFGADGDPAAVAEVTTAGVRVLTPSAGALGLMLGTTVERDEARVVVVPLPG